MEMQNPTEEESVTSPDLVVAPNYTTKLDGSIVDLTTSEDDPDFPTDADMIQEEEPEQAEVEIALDESINMEGEIIEDADLEGEVIEESDVAGEIIETGDVEGEVIEGEVLEGEIIEEEVVDQPVLEEPLTPATDLSGTTKSLTDSGRVTPVSQNADSVTYSSSEKGTPNRKARSSEGPGRKIDYDSMSSSSGSVKGGNFPQRTGLHWRKGERLEAMDYLNTWFPAKIRAINEEEMQVLIHFDGWNQRYDEWIDMTSDRLRPLVRHSERREQKKPAKGVRGRRQSSKSLPIPLNMRLHHDFKVGDAVYAKWTDCKMYPAKITNVMPTGSYEVIFYDGFKKLVQPINIRPMPNEYKSFEINPIPDVMLKKAKMKLDYTGKHEDGSKLQERARSEGKSDSSAEKEGKVKKTKKKKLVVPESSEEQATIGPGEPVAEIGAEVKSEPVSTQTEYTENKSEDVVDEVKEVPETKSAPVLPATSTPTQTPIVGTLPPKAFVVESDHNQFKCPYEGCTKGFRKEHLLDYHIKYYHINGGGPPPPPAKRRRKTTSTCSTESDGGSRRKKIRNLSAESGVYASEGKLDYPDTPSSFATETGEISTQTAVDIGEDSNLDMLKQDSLEESSVTDAEDSLKPDELVNCICDFQEENGLMIQCEVCMCWQHAACFGISENTLPKTYVCFVCENPPGVRESARYVHEQDWFKTGEIPSFSFLPLPPMSEEQCSTVKSTHTLVTEIHQLNAVLHSLKLQLKVLRTRDEAKLKLWRMDWESIEADTMETCLQEGDSKLSLVNDIDIKPTLETKLEFVVPDKTEIKTENVGFRENKYEDMKQEEKILEMDRKTLNGDKKSIATDDEPLDLSESHSKIKDEPNGSDDRTGSVESETKCEGMVENARSRQMELKSENAGVGGDEVTEVTMDLDTDADMKVEDDLDKDKENVKEVNGKRTGSSELDTNVGGLNPCGAASQGTGGLEVKDEKPDVKVELKSPMYEAEECNYSESTESVIEDSIEVCERNLLSYIVKIQGEISDRFDKIEEQIEMLEAMEAMQSRRECPTPDNVFSDMPQLKRTMRNMQDDLLKVKKMAVFH